MPDNLKKKTTKGLVWSAIERFSVQGVQFLVMIIMARMLNPGDYGLVGMLAIFISVGQSLIDSGFSQALVRKLDRTDVDFSTVFYFNILVGLFLYFIFFFCAPIVADFYNQPDLCLIMRILCLNVVFNSFSIVQRAKLTINIDFNTQAKATLIAAVASGVVGISMAYKGFGVWSIVGQQIVSSFLIAFVLWLMTKWKPLRTFSWTSFRELFSFGSKMLLSGLLNTLYNNIYPIIIGKFFSATSLGHYTRALHFADFPSSNLTGIIQRVSYPVLCEIQNNDERLKSIYRKFLKLSAYVIFPLMMGLAAIALPFIKLIIGAQWSFCATLLSIICFSMMWYPIHAINLNLLQVKGRSDLFLKLEIIKKVLGVVIIAVSLPYGLIVMCYAQILSSLICLIINTYYTGKLIGVGFFVQIKDLLPILLLSVSMFLVVYFSINHFENDMTKLLLGVLIGALYYFTLSVLLRMPELIELKSLIKK